MKELIVTGKTVDEAVEKACQQLALSRDDVHVEIIESPKRRLFGSIPAKVRVTENEDNISVKDLLFGNTDKPEKNEKSQVLDLAWYTRCIQILLIIASFRCLC